jgi:hypothetical protein
VAARGDVQVAHGGDHEGAKHLAGDGPRSSLGSPTLADVSGSRSLPRRPNSSSTRCGSGTRRCGRWLAGSLPHPDPGGHRSRLGGRRYGWLTRLSHPPPWVKVLPGALGPRPRDGDGSQLPERWEPRGTLLPSTHPLRGVLPDASPRPNPPTRYNVWDSAPAACGPGCPVGQAKSPRDVILVRRWDTSLPPGDG